MVRTAVSLALSCSLLTPAAWAVRYSCLPSCNPDDARFLSLADPGLTTLNDASLGILLSVPRTSTSLRFAVFDGDTSGRWDGSAGGIRLTYTLTADPTLDGSGTFLVGQWTQRDFADNAWTSISVPTGTEALGDDGNLYYRLTVEADTEPLAWASFKVRLENGSLFLPAEAAVALSAPILHPNDLATVYPNYPSLTPTTYDGSWSLYVFSPTALSMLDLWNGDVDFGSADCLDGDSDDSDTPNESLPAWAASATFEGIAVGEVQPCGQTTGAPTDDAADPTLRRSPSVQLSVSLPTGETYADLDPSGNAEWECFVLATDPQMPADVLVPALPAGTYRVGINGLDLNNLVVLRPHLVALGVDVQGRPVALLPPRERPSDG